jgi:hypothetical protein
VIHERLHHNPSRRSKLPVSRIARPLVLLLLAACAGGEAESVPVMFHGGPLHGGAAPLGEGSQFGAVAWRAKTGGSLRGSPVVAGGVVYVGSVDGRLYAFR